MLTVSCNFLSTCILQKCRFCQNESCQNKHSLNIFPKTILLLLWQQPLFSPSVSVSNRSSQAGLLERGHGERKDWCSQLQQVLGWGWGWPDAITDWPRGEKVSQLLQTHRLSQPQVQGPWLPFMLAWTARCTPPLGKKGTTEHPLQMTFPTPTTRELADWCLVLSQDFFSEEWLFSWKEKGNRFFSVFQCLHLDQCAPEIVLVYRNLCLLPI